MCGCTPACPPNACGPNPDGCGGTIDCQTCTPGDVCAGAPQTTCQACAFATAQADACLDPPQVLCGREEPGTDPRFSCFCTQTTSGGSICTRFARELCPCDPISEICSIGPCATDEDCVAQDLGYTHCVPCSGCTNGGRACVTACIPCPTGERLCGDTCCPVTRACCSGGVCCASGERCGRRQPDGTRACEPV